MTNTIQHHLQPFMGLFMAVGLAAAQPALAAQFSVTDLGTLGGVGSYASDINNNGQITGYAYTSDNSIHAFLYSNGTMSDLGAQGGVQSQGNSINDAGQIAGMFMLSSVTNPYRGFLYSNEAMTTLGPFQLGGDSVGLGVNDYGQVAGYSCGGAGCWAFIYSNGVVNNISPGGSSVGWSINNSGQVTGYTQLEGAVHQAFLYTGETTIWLGTLGGSHSAGKGINNLGQVTGSAWTEGNAAQRAFLWSAGTMFDLGSLGGSISNGLGINDLGQVVGSSRVAGDDVDHAFLYEDGIMKDLNLLIDQNSGWVLSEATSINLSGQITGYGIIDGQSHAFLLTPVAVPEPETYAMMLAGLGLVGFMARRRKKTLV